MPRLFLISTCCRVELVSSFVSHCLSYLPCQSLPLPSPWRPLPRMCNPPPRKTKFVGFHQHSADLHCYFLPPVFFYHPTQKKFTKITNGFWDGGKRYPLNSCKILVGSRRACFAPRASYHNPFHFYLPPPPSPTPPPQLKSHTQKKRQKKNWRGIVYLGGGDFLHKIQLFQ